VWRVLLDFPHYPDWNPFVVRIEGEAEVGARLHVSLRTQDGRQYRFRPGVLQVTPPIVLRWLGHLVVPGVLDGEHGFFLDPLPGGGTRFRQEERFQGLLAPLLWRRLEAVTAAGFEAFNTALKQRAESGK
ncbi:MAG TPA: SRPBCC domain-containing protein, partial [Rhodanobacteraceae bacterium]|nr:SRPBCC domain-containing protein [Rhodanobacteraceae bacterium]